MLTRPFVLLMLFAAQALNAHELWVEPREFQVEKSSQIEAFIKNGEHFLGSDLAYFENRNTRLDFIFGESVTPIKGRLGDNPAIQLAAPGADGLGVVVMETAPSSLVYKEWEKFLRFTAHKGFTNAATDHESNGWPKEKFRERYTRHVKSLIAIGSGEGTDRAAGLATEFIALSNPYAKGFNGEMIVRLTYQNQPRPNAQVEVFERAPEGQVDISLHRTGSDGIARVPVKAGHDYLFDAVVLRPAPDAGQTPTSPVWETLWAALTFSVPQ